MTLFQFINDIVLAAFEGLIFLLVFVMFNDKDFIRVNKGKTGIFLLAYTFISYFATTYVSMGLHTVMILVFTIALLSSVTRKNLYSSIVVSMVTVIFISAVEAGVLFIGVVLLGVDISQIQSDPNIKFIFTIVSKAIEFTVIAIFFKTRIDLSRINIFKKENTALSFIILQISSVTMVMSSVFGTSNDFVYYALLVISYAILLLLGVMEFREREKILATQRRFEVQREYVKNLETIVDAIRKEKHEYANQLSTLIAMCLVKTSDTLEKVEYYARKLIDNADSKYKFHNTGNNYVDGLFAVKTNEAFEKGIDLDIFIGAPLTSADVDDIDLASILGNIIDNAIDAVELNLKAEQRHIMIDTYIEAGKFYISIVNNGTEIPEEHIGKIFEDKFSTKKRPGSKEERGFGLFITRRLVDKNKGRIEVTSTKERTEFLLEFRVKEQN